MGLKSFFNYRSSQALRNKRNRIQADLERCIPHTTIQRRLRLEEVEAAEATVVVGARREIVVREVAGVSALHRVS